VSDGRRGETALLYRSDAAQSGYAVQPNEKAGIQEESRKSKGQDYRDTRLLSRLTPLSAILLAAPSRPPSP
jgi:hypothetical protein